jgi:proteic killer suppression protein
VARRKLDQVHAVATLDQLRIPPGHRLEALRGDRKGQHSIRLDEQCREQYRICVIRAGERASDLEIVDFH